MSIKLKYYGIIKSKFSQKIPKHTKQERSFWVVLKNIHPTTDIEELKTLIEELKTSIEELGHQMTNFWNIKDMLSKNPLTMFFIDLKPDPGNKKIYNMRFLLNCRVIFEAPRAKRQIPQCGNCQRYGHIKDFCYRNPRCIKCAGNPVMKEMGSCEI